MKGTPRPCCLICPVLTDPARKSDRSMSWQPCRGKVRLRPSTGQPPCCGHHCQALQALESWQLEQQSRAEGCRLSWGRISSATPGLEAS